MEIDVRTNEVVYIKIGNWVVYIDNSTKEQIITQWLEDQPKQWLEKDFFNAASFYREETELNAQYLQTFNNN